MMMFLSTADAAHMLNLTPATVRLLAQRGTLRVAAMTEGGMRLFMRDDVKRLVTERAVLRRTAVGVPYDV